MARLSHLELVVEVLSDATARADRFAKRWLYQDMGVPTYWILAADEHFVETWTPDMVLPAVEHERIEWLPTGAGGPLSLSRPELLRPL